MDASDTHTTGDDVVMDRRTVPDYQDIDQDRRPESPPPRGRSYSRSRSATPVPGRRDRSPIRSMSRSRSPPPRRRADRSRSPAARRYDRDDRRDRARSRSRSPPPPRSDRRRTPPPKPRGAPQQVEPTTVLGCFGLSIRTTEKDLEYEFDAIAPVDKVVVVYDARSGRSRGFGFVTMRDVDGASAAIEALNGKDLHGRRIRVDFSTTHKPHDPTPGIYKGEVRPDDRYRAPAGRGPSGGGGGRGERYNGRAYDRAGPSSYRGGDSYRRSNADSRDDWRRRPSPPRRPRRSPSPRRGGGSRYSRSPSPRRGGDRYDADREERVPPPRSRLGSHLDSPPRDEVDRIRY
ncbi:RNA recognition motif containing protein [Pseudozyma hubeiensis SY62]|uniref:RNA recognition motif containing protein n=1 Tax=Pseudozyma hubeiensis (strain SY62) TaxID=1305764 RepID=R9P6G3_PSEHS|nr:RNA recognition motif containing protein [Pseudozyma hubeiensis SY62]GAC96919.1 RNA recognition motif containing protein [Pseudozyma hubeiensis SY62]